jgi:hypothetical protein
MDRTNCLLAAAVAVHGRGIPLAFTLTGANVHDSAAFEQLMV